MTRYLKHGFLLGLFVVQVIFPIYAEEATIAENNNNSLSAQDQQRLDALEKKVAELTKVKSSGFESRKNKWFEIGGELELEYRDSQGNTEETDRQVGYMDIDKVVLVPKVTVDENASLSLSLVFNREGVEVDKAYLEMKKLWLNSALLIGLDDRFFYRGGTHRKTEGSPLIRSAFFRGTEHQIAWSGKQGWLYWNTALAQGFKLGAKQPSEDSAYKMLADKPQGKKEETNRNKTISAGLGLKGKLGPIGKIDIMGFAYRGKLSVDDIKILQGITGYGATESDDTKRIMGGYFTLSLANLTLDTMYVKAQDGVLKRDGWYIRPSIKVNIPGWKRFNAFELVARYGRLNVDLPAVPGTDFSETATWDREQLTGALIIDLYKHTKLKLEYYVNKEVTGGSEIANNELLAQLEVKF